MQWVKKPALWIVLGWLAGSLTVVRGQQIIPTSGIMYGVTSTGIPVPILAGVDGSILNGQIGNTQGSTTSGQYGILELCATTTVAPTYVNGQSSPCSMGTDGSIRVNVTNAASGGTSLADNASFTDNSTSFTPSGGVAESVSPTACAEGKGCTARMSLARGVNVVLVDSSGNYLTPGTDYHENTAVSDASTGPGVLTLRQDAPTASSAAATNRWALLTTNAYGAQWVSEVDPCASEVKLSKDVSQTSSQVIIAATSSKKTYICGGLLVNASAEILNFVEGTGSTCGTGTAALAGSTTAANGMSFAANGGFSGWGGNSSVIVGRTANVDVCLTQSGGARVAGTILYVQR